MAKRKPGRPRKVVESPSEFVAAAPKRKVGRPKKVETVESKPRLACYEVKTTNDDGFKDAESIEADDFVIAPTGELLAYRSGELIAAFREWLSIVKQEEKAAAELQTTTDSTYGSMNPILGSQLIPEPPKVTLSEANAALQSYQGQQQAAWGGTGYGQQSINANEGLQGPGGTYDPAIHVSVSSNGAISSATADFSDAQTTTFSNGTQVVGTDRPE